MANHKSAAKRARQSIVRNERNRVRRSRVRSSLKGVEKAIEAGDVELCNSALRTAQSDMARAVGKGIYKKKTMSRKISRLSKVVKALATGK